MKRALVLSALVLAASCRSDSGSLVPDYRVLTPAGGKHEYPRYSPDGAKLAWWAPANDGSANFTMWVGNADQTNARELPVVGGGPTHLIWSPDGTRIATLASNFSFADVVVVTVADGAVKRVSTGPGFEAPVAWHPDGDRLNYYASSEGGSIRSYVVRTSTGETKPLIPEERRPLVGYWSPDGSQIAYEIIENGKFILWVADSAGQSRRQLTTEGFEFIAFSAWGTSPWSPDGKEFVYESRRTGTSDIWVVSVADTAKRQLTRDVRDDFGPAWSPDGTSIAFISTRGRQTDVWLVPAAGGAEQRVTDNDDADEMRVVWRNGTNEVSYVAEQLSSSVWMRDVAGGSERQLTPDSIPVTFFNLSPDGTQFDYVIRRGGATHDLVVAPVDGGAPRTLVTGGDVFGPYWSPDGTKIAYESNRGGTGDIWVVDVAGGAPRQLMNWPSREAFPTWSGDSKTIYFLSDRDTRLGDIWKMPADGGEAVRVTRDGSADVFTVTPGRSEIFVAMILAKDGSLSWGSLRPDGTLRPLPVYDNVLNVSVPRVGDSIAIQVDRPGAGVQAMIVPIAGGRGREILARDEWIRPWTLDGKLLMYEVVAGGANDIGYVEVATGKKHRLTNTPEGEDGAEWTPDGKGIVYRKVNRSRRIYNSDLTRLLSAGSK